MKRYFMDDASMDNYEEPMKTKPTSFEEMDLLMYEESIEKDTV